MRFLMSECLMSTNQLTPCHQCRPFAAIFIMEIAHQPFYVIAAHFCASRFVHCERMRNLPHMTINAQSSYRIVSRVDVLYIRENPLNCAADLTCPSPAFCVIVITYNHIHITNKIKYLEIGWFCKTLVRNIIFIYKSQPNISNTLCLLA